MWEELPGMLTALTTTNQWTKLSVTQMRSLQRSRSALPPPVPLSTTVSASMTNPMDIHRTQDTTLATAAGTCPQLTTSGGLDPGAQYVHHVIFKLNCAVFILFYSYLAKKDLNVAYVYSL